MVTSFDIITEDAGDSREDITIENGDFRVKQSDQQHIQHILKADKGQYYQYPLVGLGVRKFQAGAFNPDELRQAIQTQLKADDYNTTTIEVSPDFVVNIDAERLK